MTLAIVQIENINLSMLEDQPFGCNLVIFPVLRSQDPLPVQVEDCHASRTNGCCSVIGDVEVKVAIAVHVSQSHRRGAESPDETRFERFRKMSMSIIQE